MYNLVKERFKKLPLPKKLIMFGGAFATVCVFLPWYSDVDRFRVGNTFLGISGPLYLAGLLVLIAGALSLGICGLNLMKKPLPSLPIEENKLHVFTGGVSVFMVILSASVYFHSKFGINLADKSARMGMYLGIVGGILLIAGGLLSMKKEEATEDEVGCAEPLIKIEDRDRAGIEHEKEPTVEDAINAGQYEGKVSTKAWDHAQESLNNYKKSIENDEQ